MKYPAFHRCLSLNLKNVHLYSTYFIQSQAICIEGITVPEDPCHGGGHVQREMPTDGAGLRGRGQESDVTEGKLLGSDRTFCH